MNIFKQLEIARETFLASKREQRFGEVYYNAKNGSILMYFAEGKYIGLGQFPAISDADEIRVHLHHHSQMNEARMLAHKSGGQIVLHDGICEIVTVVDTTQFYNGVSSNYQFLRRAVVSGPHYICNHEQNRSNYFEWLVAAKDYIEKEMVTTTSF